MNKNTSIFSVFIGVFLCHSCNNKTETTHSYTPSKLLKFEKLGDSDTSCATLSGQIFGRNETGDTIPMEGITIVISDSYEDYTSDKDGKFSSCHSEGAKEVEIAKDGYQTALLENYVAKSGQVAGFKILLEQGEGDVILKIAQ
jgi:hypothetical protein